MSQFAQVHEEQLSDAQLLAVKQENYKQEEKINITISLSGVEDINFTVKKSIKLDRVWKIYCEKQNISRDSIRFLHDGIRINSDATVGSLELEDGDKIDAMIMQYGG